MGEDRTGEPQATQERLTVAQAAVRLGITEGAVRSRIKRGTLPTSKEGGNVFVLWGGGTSQANQTANTGVPGAQSALIEALRDQIEDLRQERDEWREQARITDRLLSAAMERIPAIEASQEATDTSETTERATDRAEPHAATGEAQESRASPQQRSGWLAPVDNIPWWQYMLGICLVALTTYFSVNVIDALTTDARYPLVRYASFVAQWVIPGAIGLWIGFRQRNLRLWPRTVLFGGLVGAGATIATASYLIFQIQIFGSTLESVFAPIILFPFFGLPSWLVFVSAALVGNAWQRRRIRRISGTTPAFPISRRRVPARQQPRRDLTPAQQAMLGWGGAIISALITLIGTILGE